MFAHQAWHGGNPVMPTFEGRAKYILRTEVVFQRVDLLQPARYRYMGHQISSLICELFTELPFCVVECNLTLWMGSYLDEPLYQRARRLYELSRAFDHGVSSSGFVDVYKQVSDYQTASVVI